MTHTTARHAARRGGYARRLARRMLVTFAVAFTLGTIGAAVGILPAHAATVPTHTNWHACHETVLFSRAASVQGVSSQAAWHAAWDASAKADADLERDIRRYLKSGTAADFWTVMSDCGYGL